MRIGIDVGGFRAPWDGTFRIGEWPNGIEPIYEGKKGYRRLLEDYTDEIDEQQQMMYAHDRQSLLLVQPRQFEWVQVQPQQSVTLS